MVTGFPEGVEAVFFLEVPKSQLQWFRRINAVSSPPFSGSPLAAERYRSPWDAPLHGGPWKRLREARPLSEGGVPHGGFALSPRF